MGEENDNLKELTLAITLLVGISAILFKIVDYSNKNVVNETILSIMLFLVFFLILEVVIVVLFLLLKGYSIWPINKKRLDILKNLSGVFGIMMFFTPILILIYISLAVTFSIATEDWGLSTTKIHWYIWCIAILSALATLRLGGVDLEWLKDIFEPISLKIKTLKKSIKNLSKKYNNVSFQALFRKCKDNLKNCWTFWIGSKQFSSLSFRCCIILTYILIVLVFIIFLVQTTTFLLCGSYTIEITHFPDDNTDIMPLTIKDTGIPSGRCYINLYRINKSNESIFQAIDNIILNGSANISEYMTGEKRNGIYYLFIDTSDLPSDNYFLQAEVTLFQDEYFNLLDSKKYDDELFYLSSKNKTGNILNQASTL